MSPVTDSEFDTSRLRTARTGHWLLIAAALGGCAAPGPVAVTEAEHAERVVFTCPIKRTLEVTRVQGGRVAIVVTDGGTVQLARVSHPSAERYSNGPQTLTIFGDSATFESFGQPTPCTAGRARDRD